MKEYLSAWKKYFKFSGRARRREFWMFVLFNFLAWVITIILDNVFGLTSEYPDDLYRQYGDSFRTVNRISGGVLTTILFFASLFPFLAVISRRLHDSNRSGLWILALVLPFIFMFVSAFLALLAPLLAGALMFIWFLTLIVFFILILVWLCLDGTIGTNKYGEDPKGNGGLSEFGGVFEDRSN